VETESVGVLANGPNQDNVIGERTSLVGRARDVDGVHAPTIQR
jgi:hypothetical protein